MPDSNILQIADNYWNIRGSFKIGGIIDIGTHVSLVKMKNNKFVFLDSYSLTTSDKAEVDELTNQGEDVYAILNLHPFHTVHVRNMHAMFPNAKLYGTERHVSKNPELSWQPLHTQDPELHALFADDFEFSVPNGVDFISANENIHFSSVLALHRESKTMHVDDTYMYLQPPLFKNWTELPAALRFHPTLGRALEKRAGAAQEFREWAQTLAEDWCDVENLCAAHTAPLTKDRNKGQSINVRMVAALNNVKRVLAAHEKRFG
ncbi:MAG: hypothetical protein ACI8XV_001157 [Arenicella sp.]|jgi:hypothetical protein